MAGDHRATPVATRPSHPLAIVVLPHTTVAMAKGGRRLGAAGV